ncbi:MAG: hypothetical protein ACRCY3_00265 [Sphingorhabdus sp.]
MKRSFRNRFRVFQSMRGDGADPAFIADLEFLENRDLDLSIRLGGLLAFNALLITIGTHPISASPGAPLSLDAPTQPVLTIASIVGILPFIFSSFLCLRAILVGEEFDGSGPADNVRQRQALFAAFVHSIDVQDRLLLLSIRASIAGGVLTMIMWGWILAEKILV